jgi:SAM-dependent methyltransferase
MAKFQYARRQEVAVNVACDLQQCDEGMFKERAIFSRLYYSLEFAVGQVLSDSDTRYYPNASFSVLRFITKLRRIQRLCGVGAKFLDVGCGLGSKVWIAQELGFDAYGIEINKQYAEIAEEFVGPHRIICQDGVLYPDYDQYDVVYFFNPMPTSELEAAILKGAKQGAIIYHASGLQRLPTRDHCRLSKHVFRLTNRVTGNGLAPAKA